MNKLIRSAGLLLLVAVLVFSQAACGQRTVPEEPPVEETKEIVVETPPASPTPTPTPTPSVPPVAVTTVPMPMPSVSPTVAITNTPEPEATDTAAAGAAVPTVSPSPSAAPSPTPTPYSYDAEFASTILPDGVTVPENAVDGYLNANGVNFRGGPSTSAKIIGTFDSGTRVSILGTENGWAEVLINGVAGYVRSDYVTRGTAVGSNMGSSIPPASSTIVNDGSGIGLVIVPDGQIVPGSSSGSNTVTNTPAPSNFLGIMPD